MGTREGKRLQSTEEVGGPEPPPLPSKEQDEATLSTWQEHGQRCQAVEATQLPVVGRLEVEDGRDKFGSQQTKQQPFLAKKEPKTMPRRRLSQEQLRPWAQGEVCTEGPEPGAEKKRLPEEARGLQKSSVSKKSPVLGKISAFTKGPGSEKACIMEKGLDPEKASPAQKRGSSEKSVLRRSVPEKLQVPEQTPPSPKIAALEERSTPEKSPDVEQASRPERRLLLEKASIFEKSLVLETKLALRRAPSLGQLQSPGESQAPARKPRGRASHGKSTPSLAEHATPDPQPVASRFLPMASQEKISTKDISSPTLLTYRDSCKYSSLRAKSFPMSPRKDNQNPTLTHSASVRLPTGSRRLGEKLERYHTATKRPESVRSPGISATEVFVAPGLVASKSHFFEKGLGSQSRMEPASSHKENLDLSGIVSSRLRLWKSRIQASGDESSQV